MKKISYFVFLLNFIGILGCKEQKSSTTPPYETLRNPIPSGQDQWRHLKKPTTKIGVYSFDDGNGQQNKSFLWDLHRGLSASDNLSIAYNSIYFKYFRSSATPSQGGLSAHGFVQEAVADICRQLDWGVERIYIHAFQGAVSTVQAVVKRAQRVCGAPIHWIGVVADPEHSVFFGEKIAFPVIELDNNLKITTFSFSLGGAIPTVTHIELPKGSSQSRGGTLPQWSVSTQILNTIKTYSEHYGLPLQRGVQERKKLEGLVKSLKGKMPMEQLIEKFTDQLTPQEVRHIINPWAPKVRYAKNRNPQA